MRYYVAVTDNEWFRYLRARPDLDEVNFWQPRGGRRFRALEPGEFFLFKLHWPENYVVGGGVYTHFSTLPVSLAWEAFEDKNGAPSFELMLARLARYLPAARLRQPDCAIGCIILSNPFFFEREDWIPAPEDFLKTIVTGKTYTLETPTGRWLWEEVQARLQAMQAAEVGEPEGQPGVEVPGAVAPVERRSAIPGPLYGEPSLVRPRLGQGAFRVLVTDIYRRRCAVTGERALPTLEAAHIKPVSRSGEHRVDNGLLLRADIHKLFDRGYVTVTPRYRFIVSPKLRDDFDNGESYYPLDGTEVWLPPEPGARPSRDYLEWHADTVFLR